VILDKKLDWKAHLENRMRKAVSPCCETDLRIITKGGGLAIHFRDEAHTFMQSAVIVGLLSIVITIAGRQVFSK
jgi:hypothetical protein